MPTLDFGDDIVIINPIAASHENIGRIGHLSMEMGVWLQARHRQQEDENRARQQKQYLSINPVEFLPDDQSSIDPTQFQPIPQFNPQQPDSDAITKFLRLPHIQPLARRSEVAGSKGYRPALCNQYGILSDYGHVIAELLDPIIAEINDKTNYLPYKPQDWETADHLAISIQVSKRAARLLKLMMLAIERIEQKDALMLSGRYETEVLAQTNTNQTNDENQQKEQEFTPDLLDPRDLLEQRTIPTIIPEPVMFNMSAIQRQAWVPSTNFDSNTRRDLKHLLRYGLVDQKVWPTGGRGRPRLVIRPSTPGAKLVKNLEREEIL